MSSHNESIIPRSKFSVGDQVMVRNEDGPEPDFAAVVTGVWWDLNANHHEYSVRESDGGYSDGFTDDWLSMSSNGSVAPSPSQPIVTCVYCGHQYPEGTPTHQAELLTAHIKTCEKHPLREAEIRLKRLGKALADLVDARTKDELDAMEAAMRIMPGIESDKIAGINAIHALQAELAAGADLS